MDLEQILVPIDVASLERAGFGRVISIGPRTSPALGGAPVDLHGRMAQYNLYMETSKSLYELVGGFDRILAATRRWHELCLQDPAAAHPFEHPLHPQHDERLAAYLAEALGGPKLYTAGYGDESHVQRLHACNGEHVELDEACLKQFDQALQDVGITGPAGESFSAYFRRATEDMRAFSHHSAIVPDRLPINYSR